MAKRVGRVHYASRSDTLDRTFLVNAKTLIKWNNLKRFQFDGKTTFFYIGVPQKRRLLINVMVESIYLSGRLFELNYFGLKYANKYVNTSRFFKFSVLYKVLFGKHLCF